MTLLYADYICAKCKKEQKLMHEIGDQNDEIVFPGHPIGKELNFDYQCEFCNTISKVKTKVRDNLFVGFCDSEDNTFKGINDLNEIFNKWKMEKTLSIDKNINFKKQPFEKGKVLNFEGETFKVNKVYRLEWIEQDLDQRIENPRPDAYWYELKGKNKMIKWLRVENVEGENAFLSESGVVLRDDKEAIEDITIHPEKIKEIYKTEWFGNRKIEAYQYINGVRIIVTNYKDQTEMDIFKDTFEESMGILEENMELGFVNE